MDDHLHAARTVPVARAIAPEQTHALRIAVLRPGASAEQVEFPGDRNSATLHVGTFIGDSLAAIASIYREPRAPSDPGRAERAPDHDVPGAAWRLRGMASAPEHRRRGAGAAALSACVRHVAAAGGTLLWCNARIGAVAFYERAGWTVLGEEFDIPGIGPHLVMEQRLDRSA